MSKCASGEEMAMERRRRRRGILLEVLPLLDGVIGQCPLKLTIVYVVYLDQEMFGQTCLLYVIILICGSIKGHVQFVL